MLSYTCLQQECFSFKMYTVQADIRFYIVWSGDYCLINYKISPAYFLLLLHPKKEKSYILLIKGQKMTAYIFVLKVP